MIDFMNISFLLFFDLPKKDINFIGVFVSKMIDIGYNKKKCFCKKTRTKGRDSL